METEGKLERIEQLDVGASAGSERDAGRGKSLQLFDAVSVYDCDESLTSEIVTR
jgi:hypothetical protein